MAALLDNNSTLNDVVDRVNEILSFNEAAGNGDVAGPAGGTTVDRLVVFAGSTGKVIKQATNVSAFAYTILDDADATAARATLGLGSSATIAATNLNTASTVVQRDASGNFSAGTITATLSGNAATASTLATARTITLAGDASGSASFNGSSDITLTVAVADNSHAHTTGNVAGLDAALAGKASLGGTNLFTGACRGNVVNLPTTGTITPDFATSNNFSCTLATSITLANPTNMVAGQSGAIVLWQGGSGSNTIAYGSAWIFSNGAPTLRTGVGTGDILYYYVMWDGRIHASISKA